MKADIYTKKQLAQLKGKSRETVGKILLSVFPEGTQGRWEGWTLDTYEKAEQEYYKNNTSKIIDEIDDSGTDIHNADLQLKLERIKALQIDNQERLNNLIGRQYVNTFFIFIQQLWTKHLREITEHNTDLYNTTVDKVYSEIDDYLNKNKLEYILDPEVIQESEDISEEVRNKSMLFNTEKESISD